MNRALMPVVMKARSEEIIFLQLDSRLPLNLLNSALVSAKDGCKKVRQYLDAAIRDSMQQHHVLLTNELN